MKWIIIQGSISHNQNEYQAGDIIETDSNENIFGRFARPFNDYDTRKWMETVDLLRSKTPHKVEKERLAKKVRSIKRLLDEESEIQPEKKSWRKNKKEPEE